MVQPVSEALSLYNDFKTTLTLQLTCLNVPGLSEVNVVLILTFLRDIPAVNSIYGHGLDMSCFHSVCFRLLSLPEP